MTDSGPGEDAGDRLTPRAGSDTPTDPPAPATTSPEGAALVRQGVTASPALTVWAPILDALSLPQRRYLAAVQSGATAQQALLRAGGNGSQGVSGGDVARWLRQSVAFARAHDAIQAGLAVLGVPQARELAAADMPDLVGHWSRKARHAEKDRDQATFGRLLSDVSGATGQGAQVVVSVQSSWSLPPSPAPHQPGGIIEGAWREPELEAQAPEYKETRAPARAPVSQEQEPGRDTADVRRDVPNPERTADEKRS